MRKFLSSFLRKILKKIDQEEPISSSFLDKEERQEEVVVSVEVIQTDKPKEPKIKKQKPQRLPELSPQEKAARDITEMMEVPFLALSKNRIKPIIYEKHNGTSMIKVKISAHRGHFLASIYDWDIVLFVAGKMQEILNNGSDIPPRTMIIPRHELLKSLRRGSGGQRQKELEASLSRLQLTGIDTTIRNEDGRYRAGFGFLDSWGYTKREDVKEIHITLSQWLYDGICVKGALLLVDPDYFSITSALKRFLYRTARKHTGGHGEIWEFSVERLYEKSGSENDFRKFKSDLKEVVLKNDIPGYYLRWIEKEKKAFVSFKNLRKLPLLIDVNEKFREENLLQEN